MGQHFKDRIEEELIASYCKEISEEFSNDGLKFSNHLAGLKYTQGVNYWDYISLSTLLSLQKPLTNFPDEVIFITYHQICELYFKLCLHEVAILTGTAEKYCGVDLAVPENWIKRLRRIDFYFAQLNSSMSLMHQQGSRELLDRTEFTKFRLALIPASGFQTVQFRKIELMLTDIINLQLKGRRIESSDIDELYGNVYWKYAAQITEGDNTPQNNGFKKARTLRDFEAQYDKELILVAKEFMQKNLYFKFLEQTELITRNESIVTLLKKIDKRINIDWKGHHYSAVEHHLDNKFDDSGNDKQGGGGTNWRTYLPPSEQGVIFFPGIYHE
jgi:tryptophan 2,3-dioxygenase